MTVRALLGVPLRAGGGGGGDLRADGRADAVGGRQQGRKGSMHNLSRSISIHCLLSTGVRKVEVEAPIAPLYNTSTGNVKSVSGQWCFILHCASDQGAVRGNGGWLDDRLPFPCCAVGCYASWLLSLLSIIMAFLFLLFLSCGAVTTLTSSSNHVQQVAFTRSATITGS